MTKSVASTRYVGVSLNRFQPKRNFQMTHFKSSTKWKLCHAMLSVLSQSFIGYPWWVINHRDCNYMKQKTIEILRLIGHWYSLELYPNVFESQRNCFMTK